MNLYLKSILLIAGITIAGVGGYFAWDHFNAPKEAEAKEPGEVTADKLLEQAVATEAITTNLADGGFIRAKFNIITASKKEAEELTKLQFRVESIIIKSLNSLKKEEAAGPEGFARIEENLRNQLNKDLGADYITRVYLTEKLVQ